MSRSNTVSLIFEASQGCQMNCTGCQVNKGVAALPEDQHQAELIEFLDRLEFDGFSFDELELGPTDLVSASNRTQLFHSPFVKKLLSRFQLNTFQLSLIHPKEVIDSFVLDLNKVINPDAKIDITIPVEIKHVFNDKYLNRINENIRLLRKNVVSQIDEVVLSVIFDYDAINSVGSKRNYESLFNRVHELEMVENTMVDFVFHHGRLNLKDCKISKNFLQSFQELNKFFEKELDRFKQQQQVRKLPYQLMIEDSRPIELVYRNNQLFLRPILDQGFVVHDERFEFLKPWTPEAFRLKLIHDVNRNIEYSQDIADCQSCNHVSLCAGYHRHDIIQMTGGANCIYLLKDHSVLNFRS